MQLHTGRLYWPEHSREHTVFDCDAFHEDPRQILVVGGGISGAITAYRLAREGYPVTLIEKHTVASGSSAANTGLIQYMSDVGVKELSEQIGKKDAETFYNLSYEAVDTLIRINEDLLGEEKDNFKIEKSLILATQRRAKSTVFEEAKAQEKLGYKARYLDGVRLGLKGIRAYGGLQTQKDINLNPVGFVHRLLKTGVKKYGLRVCEHAELLGVRDLPDGEEVRIDLRGRRCTTKCRKVIYATGYDVPKELTRYVKNLILFKTYVTVTQVLERPREIPDVLLWEMKDPYTYFKKTFDDRLMIGGMDERGRVLREKDGTKNTRRLIKLSKKMLRQRSINLEAAYEYAALFGESKDLLPYMGTVPKRENLFLICGVGGNGTIYSTIASEMILDWLQGRELDKYAMVRLGR